MCYSSARTAQGYRTWALGRTASTVPRRHQRMHCSPVNRTSRHASPLPPRPCKLPTAVSSVCMHSHNHNKPVPRIPGAGPLSQPTIPTSCCCWLALPPPPARPCPTFPSLSPFRQLQDERKGQELLRVFEENFLPRQQQVGVVVGGGHGEWRQAVHVWQDWLLVCASRCMGRGCVGALRCRGRCVGRGKGQGGQGKEPYAYAQHHPLMLLMFMSGPATEGPAIAAGSCQVVRLHPSRRHTPHPSALPAASCGAIG